MKILVSGPVINETDINIFIKKLTKVHSSKAGPFDNIFMFLDDSKVGINLIASIEPTCSTTFPGLKFNFIICSGTSKELLRELSTKYVSNEFINLIFEPTIQEYTSSSPIPLSIAFCPGRWNHDYTQSQIDELISQSKNRKLDILFTTEPPREVFHGIQGLFKSDGSGNLSLDITSRVSSPVSKALGMRFAPKYHFSSMLAKYYERPPFYNNHHSSSTSRTTRFISISFVSKSKEPTSKWLYAANIEPDTSSEINPSAIPTSEIESSPSPYYLATLKKRSREGEGEGRGGEREDEPSLKRARTNNLGRATRARVPIDPEKAKNCWFCLSSPQLESHLILAVGEHVYLSLAKGGLVDHHLLIVPIIHDSSSLVLDKETLVEMERAKTSLKNYYASQDKVAVFFERAIPPKEGVHHHMHLQCLPIPKTLIDSLVVELDKLLKGPGVESETLPTEMTLSEAIPNEKEPYFYLEYGDRQRKLIRISKLKEGKFIPFNFGRKLLANTLGLLDKLDWRRCQLPKIAEEELVKKTKKEFEIYDWTNQTTTTE